jgi:methylmalonyl-CoA mutase C-terminal domain/subunit
MAMGVSGVFGPGAPLEDVTEFAFEQVAVKKAEKLVDEMGSQLTARSSNI